MVVEGSALSAHLSAHVHTLLSGRNGAPRRLVPPHTNLADVDLRGRILDRADLSRVTLRGACLAGASLREADCSDANLRDADLRGADLGGAQMTRADLRDADLRAIRFESGSKPSFADARLDGANLDGIADGGGYLSCQSLLTAARASADAYGKAFVAFLTALAFCTVTAFTTTDDKLVPNAASVQLPLLSVPVPVVFFFHLAPLLLLGIFAYTELLHREFLRALHRLPAILPDGTRPDAAYSLWILRERARPAGRWRQIRERSEKRANETAILFFASWATPLVLLLFWLRYLPAHSLDSSALQLVVFAAAALVTSVGRAGAPSLTKTAAFILAISAGLGAFSWVAATGRVSPIFNANFSHREVSSFSRPSETPEAGAALRRLDLRNRNLRGATAESAVLPDTEFTESDLSGADLQSAFLRGALFEKTTLDHTDFSGADLSRAKFKDVNIRDPRDASLGQTNFTGATLIRADMSGIDLRGLRAYGAHFQNANLEDAHFIDSNLAYADFTEARLYSAIFKDALLDNAVFKKALAPSSNFVAASMKHADFSGAQLGDADFSRGKLEGAIFTGANLAGSVFCGAALKGADLSHADLSKAAGLQLDQLKQASTSQDTVFPGGASGLASVAAQYWQAEKESCRK